MIKVIIEDLQSDKLELSYSDAMRMKLAKEAIALEHKSGELKPRDESIWTKSIADKALLKRCKLREKNEGNK